MRTKQAEQRGQDSSPAHAEPSCLDNDQRVGERLTGQSGKLPQNEAIAHDWWHGVWHLHYHNASYHDASVRWRIGSEIAEVLVACDDGLSVCLSVTIDGGILGTAHPDISDVLRRMPGCNQFRHQTSRQILVHQESPRLG